MIGYLVLALIALFAVAYLIGRRRALASVAGEISKLHSLPGHHGLFLGLAFLKMPRGGAHREWPWPPLLRVLRERKQR